MKTDVKKLVAEMTLEEKVSLLGGEDFWHTKAVSRLGIPSVMMSDGPHGLRKQDQEGDHLGINDSIRAVCFPAACAAASSFDTDLIQRMGEIIGDECQAEDVAIVLGPAVNIKRSPLCGRNFEYYSEDPYLAGKMAAAYIRGVQSRHVGTSIKHFAANNQETNRMNISVEASERTLREIYFPPFEIAVREARPRTVMCSYNKIGGVYSADNEWLLNDVLRGEWGFEGFVMTDWGAVNDRVRGVQAGLELEMPGNTAYNDALIADAVREGRLSEEVVDRAAERILRVIFDYLENHRTDMVFDRERDHVRAEQIEEECAVLLENNGILPLDPGKKIVYIGEFAEKPRYQGGGSSHIRASEVVSALDAARAAGRTVTYVRGFPADRDEEDPAELDKAVAAAREADAAVIFAGLPDVFESEGYDRKDMCLPGCQNRLIEEVLCAQPNTIVVLHNGSAVEVPWADDAAAILEMFLGGQGVGKATDRILYGEVNPSGHLAETFPYMLQDTPAYLHFPGDGKKVSYAEGVFVGYRYYDTRIMPVRWAFGHGLSYTAFRMDNLRLSSGTLYDDTTVNVTVDVTNIGSRAGKEVVQLYISDLNGTPERPVKELKGFAKIYLEPGETGSVTLTVDARSLSMYHEELHDWYAPAGLYQILIGNASDNISLWEELRFETKKQLPLKIAGDTTVGELLADPRTSAVVQEYLSGSSPFGMGDGGEENGMGDAMTEAMIRYLPLKALAGMGMLEREKVSGLLERLHAAAGDAVSSRESGKKPEG